ncbi:MAG: YhgE/Pip family protein [Gordonibacter pamelaeae]
MGNVLRVLKRDVLRLLKTPPALVVVLALLVLPSVYTWYNVVGFWDPYNNTGALRVCVVNEDEGGSSDLTGELHVGDMIVDELHGNTQLDWVFVDRDDAMAELDAGKSYAAFVIPSGFTSQLLSLTTGDFTQPKLEYYVNEKAGPVAPKITDTGASTLDETINSTFVSTVSDVAADAIDQALGESREKLDASRSRAVEKIAQAVQTVGEARETLAGIGSATDEAQGKVGEAKDALCRVRADLGTASDALQTVSGLTTQMQDGLASFSAAAMPAVGTGLSSVSQASSKANQAVGDIAGTIGEAQGSVRATLAQAQAVVDEDRALAAYLKSVADGLPEDNPGKQPLAQAAAQLEQQAADAQATLDDLTRISADTETVSQATAQAGNDLNAAVQQAVAGAQAYSDNLFGTTIPAVNGSLAQLGAASSSLATAVSNQRVLVDQTSLVLDQLASTLCTAKDALGQTDGILASLEEGLDTVRTDVLSLGQSGVLAKLVGEDGLDASKIADFMGSPTELETEELYPLNAYGSAMAPLFMNLTFWIGAFMLLVIMKQEVDGEGIRNLTVTQRYLGRFALLAVMAVLQAVICCAGVLVIGVQAASAPALFFAAAVASLAYLASSTRCR